MPEDPIAQALDRLAQAVEARNDLERRRLEMHESDHREHVRQVEEDDKLHVAFEQGQVRRAAAIRVLYRKIVMPVVEKFMTEGGLEMIQSLLSGDKDKPS